MSCIVLLSHHPPLPTTVGIHIVFLVAGLTLLVLLVKSTMLPQLVTRSRKHDRVRARRQRKAECSHVYLIFCELGLPASEVKWGTLQMDLLNLNK